MNQSEIAKENLEHQFKYLSIVELNSANNQASSVIEVLRVGTLFDRGLSITKQMLEEYVENFKTNVYGTQTQVNLGHNREGEAAGWIKQLFIQGDSLMAEVEWTVLGQEKISKKLYKFISAELASKFRHFETGKVFNNVFIGAALTNTPALKGQEPIGLSEELNTLFLNNEKAMFKKFLSELQARTHLSEEDKKLAHTMLAELPPEEQEEHKEEMEQIDNKPTEAPVEEKKEEEEKKGEGEGEAKEKEEEKTEEQLAEEVKKDEEEKMEEKDKKGMCKEQKCSDKKCMTHFEKDGTKKKMPEKKEQKLNESLSIEALNERIIKLEEENATLKKNEEMNALNEEVEEKLMLSSQNSTGFAESQKENIVNFLADLTQEQRETFYSLMQEVQTVDLSTKGFNPPISSKNQPADFQDQVVRLSEQLLKDKKADNIAAAQKMAVEQLNSKK